MNKKIQLATIIIFTCPLVIAPYKVHAVEISVTGNGAETVNEAVVNSADSANINQNNDAQIFNNSSSNSDTGGNTAANNNSDSAISTGDAAQNSTINNNVNESSVNQGCCPESQTSASINISNNGAGSISNAVNQGSDNQVINTNNQANITNNINNKASTGENAIYSNSGSSTIKTGNVYSNITVTNDGINKSHIEATGKNRGNNEINIKGNGANSINIAKLDSKTKSIINGENNAVIRNYIASENNTGNNKIAKSLGLSGILTGDIFSDIKIGNALNKNLLIFECCIKKAEASEQVPAKDNKGEDKPSQQPAASPSTSGGVSSSISSPGSSGSSGPTDTSGQVAGVTARHLPITGNNWLFFSLLGNIIMLFLGAYLRLRSGNAPPAFVQV